MDTGRLDRIVIGLAGLQAEADEIIDAYVVSLACRSGSGYGATKAAYIFPRVGSQLNYVKALEYVREQLNGR
jgi:hypothetical protein